MTTELRLKGRRITAPAGSLNGRAVLSEGDVVVIRQRLRGGESREALAREFSVTASNVRAIASRRSWRHL